MKFVLIKIKNYKELPLLQRRTQCKRLIRKLQKTKIKKTTNKGFRRRKIIKRNFIKRRKLN